MKRQLLLATALTSVLFSSVFAQAQTRKSAQLFELIPQEQVQTFSKDATITTLQKDGSTRFLGQIKLNTKMIDGATNDMYLPFGPGMVFPVKLSNSYWLNSDYQVWAGAVEIENIRKYNNKNPNRAVFVRNKDRVFGQVNVDGRIFEIMTMENGKHMVVERDFSQLGIADDTPAGELPIEDNFASNNILTSAAAARSNIRVLQIASATVLNRFGKNTVRDRMSFFLAQANDVYANNGIDIVLRDAGRISSRVAELASVTANVIGLRDPNDGFLDNFAGRVRDNRSADIVALITDNDGDRLCGRVNDIGGGQNNGFFVTRHTCTGFTFVHEIGHLFGARHDNDPTQTPFAFGHGFVNAGGNFRTVMAVNSNPQPRIGFFSTDDQRFNGGILGNASVADNERVHQRRRNIVANFR
ncbi:M12 family metallo-peptidase [Agarilytica rhodophyticola]|uniref:M12 family metallo-peptidase n=1 Tax=Agarilytica rhodophyticola TaxID=1737490 RepID=UPI000B347841|nr:M12 family metallo-peptidase [Agarilytica rhodophyticola]